jgi:peptide/nickel transport system ATP-binding protein
MSDRVITMYLGRIVEESPASAVTDHARHPYTRALFSATPGLLDPIDPIPLTGPVPSATHPPSGCPFRTRCWRATEICSQQMPPFADASSPGHRYRCHHPVQEGQATRDLVHQAVTAPGGSASPPAADVPVPVQKDVSHHPREPET